MYYVGHLWTVDDQCDGLLGPNVLIRINGLTGPNGTGPNGAGGLNGPILPNGPAFPQ